MIQFLADEFVCLLNDISRWSDHPYIVKYEGRKIDQQTRAELLNLIDRANDQCAKLGLVKVKGRINPLRILLQKNDCLHEPIDTELQGLRFILIEELGERKFAFIPPDKMEFLEQPDLFGDAVNKAFPAAKNDIKEAGSSLAVDLNTAAIFHLMRVVEIGLRAFARYMKVRVPKTPLEYAEWGVVIQNIEQKLRHIQSRPRGKKKAEELEFYHGIMGEFNAFKDIWRNNVMHTRRDYNEHDARGVLLHVRSFMQRLAGKLQNS